MSNSKSDWATVNQSFSLFKKQRCGEFGDLETGMYLHIKDSDNRDAYYLVGDINNVNGVCDCCNFCESIKDESIVVRYKMIELSKD